MSKSVTLLDFLTEEQITKADRIVGETPDMGQAAKRLRAEVIEPNMAEIDRKLGQENDPAFMAYATLYVLLRLRQ